MHETSAWAWCTEKTQRNRVEREVGRGVRMGNACKSMADSCQCMTDPLWYCKVISLQLIKINEKKKGRDITWPTKVHLVKAMVFPVVMYGCESWTIKKAEHQRMDAFELWCWRRLLRVS